MKNISPLLIGAIGDDMTGSTDLALMLAKQGMSIIQYIGIPSDNMKVENAHSAVIALKIRTSPVDEAINQSLSACEWLIEKGARQIVFKYCSTFDSTASGNIGPVAESLMKRLGVGITVFCPAFPDNGRTLYNGHLFVEQDLLSESGMRNHPLTPMKDSNLVRFLGKQVSNSKQVSLVSYLEVNAGPQAIKNKLGALEKDGIRFAIVDSLTNKHLLDIGKACSDFRLVTGGSGISMGLPDNFRSAGLLTENGGLELLPKTEGNSLVIAGSCSLATRKQVAMMAMDYPSLRLDPSALVEGNQSIQSVIEWIKRHISRKSVLIYSTAEPEKVAEIQSSFGRRRSGDLLENAFAAIATEMLESGISKFIVAGGETSGAVVKALGIKALRIGPEIAPGVPWTFSDIEPVVCLALKSGNFGDETFFEKALGVLP
jgi:uncharacterized protein YgbK (DUF1537 family)